MSEDAPARVGIGVPPDHDVTHELEVNGTINVITLNDEWAGILFSDEGGDRGAIRYDHNVDKMDFKTASTTRMAIDSSGRVGIGTTSPTAALHAIDEWTAVRGIANGVDNAFNYGGYFTANGSAAHAIHAAATSSDPTAVNFGGYIISEGGQGTGLLAKATGTKGKGIHGQGEWIGVFGQGDGPQSSGVRGHGQEYDFYALGPGEDFASASSIRWKTDVRPIGHPLDKVAQLRGVYFDWDVKHGGHHDLGMIAEEVGEVLPEIVQYEENGIDATGMDYSKLTPLLVEAVKALKKENDKLQEQNNRLESRLSSLENAMRNGSLIGKKL